MCVEVPKSMLFKIDRMYAHLVFVTQRIFSVTTTYTIFECKNASGHILFDFFFKYYSVENIRFGRGVKSVGFNKNVYGTLSLITTVKGIFFL